MKRQVPQYLSELSRDFDTAAREGKSAYVTAQLLPRQFRGTFIVGDNRTYGGYFNGPLQQDQKYTIWLGAYSTIDGVYPHSVNQSINHSLGFMMINICDN